MKNRRVKNSCFTLIEILAAMAVFLILSVVIMRFFSSSQKVWSRSSQRNLMYSDVRIVFDMITRDLQCALYNNDNSTQGIYPFWLQYTPFSASNYYTAFNQTQLNFISATELKANTHVESNISEVRYEFIPAGTTLTQGTTTFNGGSLLRSCTGDKTDADAANAKYNFASEPFSKGTATRVQTIFQDSSSEYYQEVITGVYMLKFSCFTLNAAGVLQTLAPMQSNGSKATGYDVSGFGLLTGTPFPVAVRVELQMFTPGDWEAWRLAIVGGDSARAEKIKRQKLRSFSKTIFLGIRESE